MRDETLIHYFKRFSRSLHHVTYQRTGHFYHKNDLTRVEAVYVCPLCLTQKVGLVEQPA